MDLVELIKEPIRPDKPAGDDARYDPVFQELQGEVDHCFLPSVAGAMDWEKVVKLATEILTQKSKDLVASGYLSVGLIHTRGTDGLALALKIQRDLVQRFGRDLFPQRERGRVRALEWWLEKSKAALAGTSPCAPAQLTSLQQDLGDLERLLGQLLPNPPSLDPLRNLVETAVAEAAAEMPPSVNAGVPLSPERSVPVVPDLGMPPVPRDGGTLMEEGLHRLREAAGMLRADNVRNPSAYRLSRQAAWLGVAELPPAKEGRTLLPPPTSTHLNRLRDLKSGGGCTEQLMYTERLIDQHIFWLDLNRFAMEALTELGEGESAIKAIREETVFFLTRMAGLEHLAFADGTPFADAETLKWLQGKDVRAPKITVTAPLPEVPIHNGSRSSISGEIDAAAVLIGNGHLLEATEVMQAGLDVVRGERERLQWRLAISKLLITSNHNRFALPYLEQVVDEIDRFGLESYDPLIALEGLRLAWHGFEAQEEKEYKEKASVILHRIARLDLAEMVRLAKE